MRKRLTAGLVALFAALSMTGATPAFADYHTTDDFHKPIPCNVYPAGKPFNLTASPTRARIKKGTNINAVAILTRGVGKDKQPCKYYLIILRYKSRPGSIVATHRTGERGTAAFVIKHVTGTLRFYFDLLYNNRYYSSNDGVITVF